MNECAEAVGFLEKLNKVDRTYTLSGPIDSLRLEAGRGYAQYHGREGKDWIVPVLNEQGTWKVTILDPLDRLK